MSRHKQKNTVLFFQKAVLGPAIFAEENAVKFASMLYKCRALTLYLIPARSAFLYIS